ncbi:MAG: alpha/beta fold hydrolase [Flavobacteriales bacterium]|nr:alpha/beta fold hydrolase [Flavobacteriales bacterium]MBL4734665.1 alpha/beta fold hydrolase [Flavobacteriales bacterium]
MDVTDLNKVEYSIAGIHGKSITFDVTKPRDTSLGLVVFCHGFKGFKDWGHFNLVAAEFASQGLTFLKMNFSHNGTTAEKPTDFADLEAFANNNFSVELDDLGVVLDWAEEHLLHPNEELYLMGHSRGGGIAILKTAEDQRVNKLVTWSAVSDFESRFPPDMDRFKNEGVVYIPNARTNQNMPLHYQFVEDYYAHEERLNIPKRLNKVDVPYLILHGTEDEAVSLECAEFIHGGCEGAVLKLIDGAGHTFGGKHPFEEAYLPGQAQEAVNLSIDFFKGDR